MRTRGTINTNSLPSLLLVLLFFIGMSFPASLNGVISKYLLYTVLVITFLLILVLILFIRNIYAVSFVLFIFINASVWSITLFNQKSVDYVQAFIFTIITLLFCVNLSQIKIKKIVFKSFKIVNIMVILIGWGMVFKLEWLGNFFIKFYTAFYPELVINMLNLGKPVIVFGTHSVSAFYMFVFFFLNLKTFESFNKKRYLLYAINYLVFCYLLQSNTGVFFIVLGIVLLIYRSKRKYTWTAISTLILIFAYLNGRLSIVTGVYYKFFSQYNGILSRYALEGNQSQNIRHILNNPFSATGFSRGNGDLIFYDSGIISFSLMGTVGIMFLVYASMYLFFRKNIINKKSGLVLFVALLFFEIGFNNLQYFRTICIIPFLVVYLNYLEIHKETNLISH